VDWVMVAGASVLKGGPVARLVNFDHNAYHFFFWEKILTYSLSLLVGWAGGLVW
jgi:hypothetical protein